MGENASAAANAFAAGLSPLIRAEWSNRPMIKICCYQDLNQIKDLSVQSIIRNDFVKLWKEYGQEYELMEYRLNELGEFIYTKNQDELVNLSDLGYVGSFYEQLFESIEIIHLKDMDICKGVVIRDNDGGTVFYIGIGR